MLPDHRKQYLTAANRLSDDFIKWETRLDCIHVHKNTLLGKTLSELVVNGVCISRRVIAAIANEEMTITHEGVPNVLSVKLMALLLATFKKHEFKTSIPGLIVMFLQVIVRLRSG